jgi:hypothetical protein
MVLENKLQPSFFSPGGTADISRWWNHRKFKVNCLAPEGRQTRAESVAPPGLGNVLVA